jgi:hypothetical protein
MHGARDARFRPADVVSCVVAVVRVRGPNDEGASYGEVGAENFLVMERIGDPAEKFFADRHFAGIPPES